MDLRKRYQDRSDDKETQYIPAQQIVGKKSTDQYDTQQLSAEEIRNQAQQERRARSAYNQRVAAQNQNRNPNGNQYGNSNVNPNRNQYANSNMNPNVNQYANSNMNPNMNPNGNQYANPNGNPNMNPNRSPNMNANYAAARNGAVQTPVRNNRYGYAQPQGGGQRRSANPPPQQRTAQKRPRNRRRSGMPFWQKLLKTILILIIVLFLLYSAVALVGIFRTNIVATAERNRTSDAMSSSYVDNILVIGTDSRDITTDAGRSDSMILISLNSRTHTIYMTSFLRDVYVYINDEYGYGKLNAAYAYGGPELLMDTIESNYQVQIDDYMVISFSACCAMVDAVGGVEITLSDEEAQALNEILISEVNELMGDGRNDDLLDGGGTYTLNGKQALSYSRIRYVGNADFERTSRQREVFSQVLHKASYNPIALGSMMMYALPQITTNMSGLSMYGYALKAPYLLLAYDVEQQQIPVDNSFYDDVIGGESVLVADFEQNRQALQETIFE
jgi:LCP family protein required for cell wall assembly